MMILAATGACGLLAGCNAAYIYETEKISLTLEGRPDPSSPITGTLGIKQRVVAFVPSTEDRNASERSRAYAELENAWQDMSSAGADEAKKSAAQKRAHEAWAKINQDPAGDAVSVLCSFRFQMVKQSIKDAADEAIDKQVKATTTQPATKNAMTANADGTVTTPQGEKIPVIFPRVRIDTALITGIPAQDLQNTAQVISALSGEVAVGSTTSDRAAISMIYGYFSKANDDAGKAIKDRLDKLAGQLPGSYDFNSYTLSYPGDKPTLSHSDPAPLEGSAIAPNEKGFNRVITYWNNLAVARKTMPIALSMVRSDVVIAPGPNVKTDAKSIAAESQKIEDAWKTFKRDVLKSPAVSDAVRYFFSNKE